MTEPRRFQPPWRLVELEEAIRIEDASGFPVAYVYLADDEQRRSAAQRMSREEARRIAIRIAAIPEMQIAMMELENERDEALALSAKKKH
ncbi:MULTISPECIES: hypothetical protein [Methylobacterium]|uniref:Uncharacterized protein n=1 Tax=Methylobacterium durans TaxID=2202825 RepID=A0A2U8WAM6_9HYPH|nr:MULTISPECIES: hypothetical protein [Methylobacterium]AWN43205.1 hypothetical protein DK389_25260 [Methylobacterium durans]